jgi:hypothetical protein
MKVRIIQYDDQHDYELEIKLDNDKHWISLDLNKDQFEALKQAVLKPEKSKSYGN